VIEHATTDATTDTGAPGDSAGDVLTFANKVFDADDQQEIGSDQGYCIRTVAGTSYECNPLLSASNLYRTRGLHEALGRAA
jgi:hypothetical protein